MAIFLVFLSRKVHGQRDLGRLQSVGLQRVERGLAKQHQWSFTYHFPLGMFENCGFYISQGIGGAFCLLEVANRLLSNK